MSARASFGLHEYDLDCRLLPRSTTSLLAAIIGFSTMLVRSIDHVQLAMPPGGEDQARAFYQGLLGIPEVPKPPNLAKRGGCWFEDRAVKIHLGVEPDFRTARKAHPALIVEDLQRLAASITRAGYPVVKDEPLEGYHRVFVNDPFGNRIELMQPTSA